MKRTLIAGSVTALLLSLPAWAQQAEHEKHHPGESPVSTAPAPGSPVRGPGAGSGMMGCAMMAGSTMGPGMMGPGMMGPGMMGPGMMGPGMMERGMSRGRMMGPGMMGQGMGPGAMLDGLDLTEEQQTKVQKIHDELRDRHWESMGQMMKEGSRMRDLFAAPKMDRPALEAAHRRVSALRDQMFMAQLDAYAQLEALLTPEQRAKLHQRMRGGGWMMMH